MRELTTIFAAIFFSLSAVVAWGADCRMEIPSGKSKLTWTGYKFTEKLGVNGSFDIIQFEQNKKATSVDELFRSISFTIDTASINSGDPGRDKKLALYIFGPLKIPGQITGKVAAFDMARGTATAELDIGGTKTSVPFKVTSAKGSQKVKVVGEIDLVKIGMKRSYDLIAAACKPPIPVPMAKPRLGPVTLTVETEYAKACH